MLSLELAGKPGGQYPALKATNAKNPEGSGQAAGGVVVGNRESSTALRLLQQAYDATESSSISSGEEVQGAAAGKRKHSSAFPARAKSSPGDKSKRAQTRAATATARKTSEREGLEKQPAGGEQSHRKVASAMPRA